MEHSATSFSSIKSRLATIRDQDPDLHVFGSSLHKYESTPDSFDDLERLHRRYGLTLTSDYKRFLFEFGYGAGPYYGILSLFGSESEIHECFDTAYEEEADALAILSLSSPFPSSPIKNGDVLEHDF